MASERNTYSVNVATSSTLRASKINKSGKISTTRFSYQVAGTQAEIPKTVLEGTASRVVTKTLVKASATKELKEYVNAMEDNFEIHLNYSLGQ